MTEDVEFDKWAMDGLMQSMRSIQESMSDKQRLDFWHYLQIGYCEYCGTKVEEGRKCYCHPAYDL